MHAKIVVTAVVLFFTLCGISLAEEKKRCDAEDKKAVESLREAGLVMKVGTNGYDVYVSKAWYGLPLDTKRTVTFSFLQCLSPGNHVSVYDGFSGKKLARFGTAFGFTNYEE